MTWKKTISWPICFLFFIFWFIFQPNSDKRNNYRENTKFVQRKQQCKDVEKKMYKNPACMFLYCNYFVHSHTYLCGPKGQENNSKNYILCYFFFAYKMLPRSGTTKAKILRVRAMLFWRDHWTHTNTNTKAFSKTL